MLYDVPPTASPAPPASLELQRLMFLEQEIARRFGDLERRERSLSWRLWVVVIFVLLVFLNDLMKAYLVAANAP